jgi:6-pyruvoyltetrahydropterin/6-carboxytetrahydropterin synthase
VYTTAVRRSFIAQHYLVGGDWGSENEPHSHPYVVELQLEGAGLDQHGYLLDITEIERSLDQVLADYRDHTLNDLPDFAGLNPSIEHFARLLCEQLAGMLRAPNIQSITVKLWEHEHAWTAFRLDVGSH